MAGKLTRWQQDAAAAEAAAESASEGAPAGTDAGGSGVSDPLPSVPAAPLVGDDDAGRADKNPARPALNASTVTWAEYANALGFDVSDLDNRQAIIDRIVPR